jgi:hypothetical protein
MFSASLKLRTYFVIGGYVILFFELNLSDEQGFEN